MFYDYSAIELLPHDAETAGTVNQSMQDVENMLCRVMQKGKEKGTFTNS